MLDKKDFFAQISRLFREGLALEMQKDEMYRFENVGLIELVDDLNNGLDLNSDLDLSFPMILTKMILTTT